MWNYLLAIGVSTNCHAIFENEIPAFWKTRNELLLLIKTLLVLYH